LSIAYANGHSHCNCDGNFYTYGDTYVDAESYSHTEAASDASAAAQSLADQ